MLFSPTCFCPFLEEFSPPSLANVLFQGYRFLKVLSDIDCGSQALPFLITPVNTEVIHKRDLMIDNSILRGQFFLVFLQYYFLITKSTF